MNLAHYRAAMKVAGWVECWGKCLVERKDASLELRRAERKVDGRVFQRVSPMVAQWAGQRAFCLAAPLADVRVAQLAVEMVS